MSADLVGGVSAVKLPELFHTPSTEFFARDKKQKAPVESATLAPLHFSSLNGLTILRPRLRIPLPRFGEMARLTVSSSCVYRSKF